MKYLYKYPQREYPYRDLIETNRRRSRTRVRSTNCSIPAPSTTTGISTCSWNTRRPVPKTSSSASPCTIAGLKRPGFVSCRRSGSAIPGRGTRISRSRRSTRWDLASFRPHTTSLASTGCSATAAPELLFTENESNASRLWGQPNASPYVKDAFHEYIVSGRGETVNPAKVGTKAAAHYVLDVPAGGSKTVSLRLAAAWTDEGVGGFKVGDAFGGFDTDIPEPDRGRGRILRSDYAEVAERGRTARAPPGAGGHALEQAVLLLRPRAMAARAQEPSAARFLPARRAEHRMVPHAQCRRHLHAGQMGVSLVRGLGPGVPHDSAVAGGFRFRQGAAAADAAQSLCPPQRADSRLRVELRRREPAGARLGDASISTRWNGTSAGRTVVSWNRRFRA